MRVSLMTLALLPAAAFGFMAPAMPTGVAVRQASITSPAAASPLFLRSDRVKPTFSGAPAGGVGMDAGLKGIGFPELKASGMRIGIVHSRWNADVVVSAPLLPLPPLSQFPTTAPVSFTSSPAQRDVWRVVQHPSVRTRR